jgi:uncharacterized repeat protein (TIGR03803 family)
MTNSNWGMKACGIFLLWATAAIAVPAQTTTVAPTVTFTTLHSFDNTDGANSEAGLIQATDGKFYGTTIYGGASDSCSYGYGCGTFFSITTGGAFATVYSFCSQTNCTDGEFPGGVVQSTDGNFYGPTGSGGSSNACTQGSNYGCGTVFKITPSGTLTVLHSFDVTDGAGPQAALIQGTDGNFYGTTGYGGANFDCYMGAACGTVFRITARGMFKSLYSFDSVDGAVPLAALVQGTDGKFYGTTAEGGAGDNGTVFKITPGGTLTVLGSFDGTDGRFPAGGLVEDTDGNFYGTTVYGGSHNFGTVFRISPSGRLRRRYNFCRYYGCKHGSAPFAGLIQGTDGNFYGTTSYGGPSRAGTIFRITPEGKLATLHTFCHSGHYGCPDGEYPYAMLVQGTDGKFYGTTSDGGSEYDYGTIFSLSVGLGPFVKTLPTSGQVGKAVKILGTNLTGATSVTFNRTAATFTVKSKAEIITTVPTGATTGTVQVVTPNGTLSSNAPFRVTP